MATTLDVTVAARMVELASTFGAPGGADDQQARDGQLDGTELVQVAFDLPVPKPPAEWWTVTQILAGCAERLPAELWTVRGAILLGISGTLAVGVGHGYVVEPAGGTFALTDPDLTRWASAWLHPDLVVTVP